MFCYFGTPIPPLADHPSVRRERFWRRCPNTSHSFPGPYLSQLTGPFPRSGLLCWVHQNGKCGLPTNCKRYPCSRGARFLSLGAHTAMRRRSPRLSKIPLRPSLSPPESTFPSPSLGLDHLTTRGHFLVFPSSMRSAHGRQKSTQDGESPLPQFPLPTPFCPVASVWNSPDYGSSRISRQAPQ